MYKEWSYKNFNMVVELDIAGEFIYNGIHGINELSFFSNYGPTFTAIYSIAVGIERLQKIVYVLWGMDDFKDKEEFEKSLITHSHTGLRDKINSILRREKLEISFNKRENAFLSLLTTFYKSARYMRFNVEEEWDKEVQLLKEYIDTYINNEDLENIDEGKVNIFFGDYPEATERIKEHLGRVVGSISKKYYELVKIGSSRNGTYTYELRNDSKAFKVFLNKHKKNSLTKRQIEEQIALKELLIYLRCSKKKNAFLKYIDNIEPLSFDPNSIIGYLKDIISGNISQDLIDKVECMYQELENPFNRIKMLDLFAKENVSYDYPFIKEGWEIIQEILKEGVQVEYIEKFEELKEYIDEIEIVETIDKIIYEIKLFKVEKNYECFNNTIKNLSKEYRNYLIEDVSEEHK